MNLRLAVVAGLALGLAGCTNELAKMGTSDAVLLVAAINGGAPLASTITDTPTADRVVVTLAARSKNIRFNDTQYTRAFMIERYEVRFYRSDGRNVEGVDVPVRIAGNISGAIDIGEPSENVDLEVEVVRAQAKLEPPLRNLRDGGGAIVLTCFAEITVYARQIATGDVAEAKGTLQIDFSGIS